MPLKRGGPNLQAVRCKSLGRFRKQLLAEQAMPTTAWLKAGERLNHAASLFLFVGSGLYDIDNDPACRQCQAESNALSSRKPSGWSGVIRVKNPAGVTAGYILLYLGSIRAIWSIQDRIALDGDEKTVDEVERWTRSLGHSVRLTATI